MSDLIPVYDAFLDAIWDEPWYNQPEVMTHEEDPKAQG